MSIRQDDLVEDFWRRAPERVATATNLWLDIEEGKREPLPTLRRLLHTVKGEAAMLGLEACSDLLERAEHVIDAVRLAEAIPEGTGDVVLGAIEAFGFLAVATPEEEASDFCGLYADLETILEKFEQVTETQTPRRSDRPRSPDGEPEPNQEPESTPEGTGGSAGSLEVVRQLAPLIHELRRLHGEQALLQPHLRDIQGMLRAFLGEVDLRLNPEALKERLVKTLGYGAEMNRRLANTRTMWAANDFAGGMALEQLERRVDQLSLVPMDDLKQQVVRVARTTARALDKQVQVLVSGDALLDTNIEARLRPCLVHVIRNAVDHGLEAPEVREANGKPAVGTIRVNVTQKESAVLIVVEDDGAGVDFDRMRELAGPGGQDLGEADLIRMLFAHGTTTKDEVTSVSGRGVGLDVVAREIRAVGGDVAVETTRGTGTRFLITMPVTLRADLVIPIRLGDVRYAIPSRSVKQVIRPEQIEETAEGPRAKVSDGGEEVLLRIWSLHHLIDHHGSLSTRDPALVIHHENDTFVVTVDGYENPRAVTFQRTQDLPFDSNLVHGVAPTADGGVLLLLDIGALKRLALGGSVGAQATVKRRAGGAHILVAEDAPVARELLAGVLRSFGYRVTEATDGRVALERVLASPPDVLLTDIEMPFMDGLELVGRLRELPETRDLPVVMLTTRTDTETRDRARALGIKRFLSKQKFVEQELRDILEDCLRSRR